MELTDSHFEYLKMIMLLMLLKYMIQESCLKGQILLPSKYIPMN